MRIIRQMVLKYVQMETGEDQPVEIPALDPSVEATTGEEVIRAQILPRKPLTGGGVPLSEVIGHDEVERLTEERREARVRANQAYIQKLVRGGIIRHPNRGFRT